MATDQELLDIVVRFFVESRDFNGIPASGLARATKSEWPDVQAQLSRMVQARAIDLVFASHSGNPHIKRVQDLPIDEQLARLTADDPSSLCVYPSASALRGAIDDSKYAGQPYTRRLAMAEPQLVPVFFELRVLAQYFNDPRYFCRFFDRSGMLSVSDAHYQSTAMPEKHQVMLETFGIGYDEQRLRVVVVFLRYLADLSPEHQRIWEAHEVHGKCTMNSDYARASIYGDWPEFHSVYEAFFAEQREINRLCELIDRPPLFKEILDEDRRPLEFAPMLLPTQRQLYAFAQTLDKLLSENVNRDFFKDDIPMEDRIEAKDGSIERRQVGTITLIERFLKKHYRTANGEEVSREVVTPWRKVRELRNAPSHSLRADAYDLKFPGEQDTLLGEAVRSLTRLRLVFSSHPKARGRYTSPDWLDGDKIVFY